MGSYATLNVFAKLLEKFPAQKEWERPRIIIDNNCTMPSRVRAILYNENVDNLISEMTASLSHMVMAGATDIILACNTSHVFLNKIYEINPNLKNYIHNIIELSVKFFKKNSIKSAYLVASEGTILSNIFNDNFSKEGIDIKSSKEDFEIVRQFIECVKNNTIKHNDLKSFVQFINSRPEDTVILGCTELPILYDLVKDKINKRIINPIEIAIENIYEKFIKQKNI